MHFGVLAAALSLAPVAMAQDSGPRTIRNVTPSGILPGPEITGQTERVESDIFRYPQVPNDGRRFQKIIVYDATEVRIGRVRMKISGIAGPAFRDVCKHESGVEYPCGREARAALRAWIGPDGLLCKYEEVEDQTEVVGDCTKNGQSMAAWLIESGHGIPETPDADAAGDVVPDGEDLSE